MQLRSCLVIRADRACSVDAALASGAGTLLFELISHDETLRGKEREWARDALMNARPRAQERGVALYVRVSPAESATIDADLAAVIPAAPDGVFLEDARGLISLRRLAVKLAVQEAEAGLADGSTRIVALATQTAGGVFGLGAYAGATRRLAGLAFDGAGLPGGAVTTLARSMLLLGAASAGVGAIDVSAEEFTETDATRASCVAARRDGFIGKAALSLEQVAIIEEIFG